jgi:hypothetical protein
MGEGMRECIVQSYIKPPIGSGSHERASMTSETIEWCVPMVRSHPPLTFVLPPNLSGDPYGPGGEAMRRIRGGACVSRW